VRGVSVTEELFLRFFWFFLSADELADEEAGRFFFLDDVFLFSSDFVDFVFLGDVSVSEEEEEEDSSTLVIFF
jgi:hypothetical protein